MNENQLQEQLGRYESGLLLTHHIESPRTVRLLDDVWERVPDEDQEVLRESVRTTVVEGPSMKLYDPDALLEAVDRLVGAVEVDDVHYVVPQRTLVLLDSDVLSNCNDAAARGFIGRQLAHAILRHPSMIYPLALGGDSVSDVGGLLETVTEVHEWEADLQAWMWGFSAELLALWEQLRSDVPPWYHRIEAVKGRDPDEAENEGRTK